MKAFPLQLLSFTLLVLSACVRPNEPVLTPGQLTLSVSQIDFKEARQATFTLQNIGQKSLTWTIPNLETLKWLRNVAPRSSTLVPKAKMELILTLDRAKLQSGTNTDSLTIQVSPANTTHIVGLRAFLAAKARLKMTSADISAKTSTSARAKSTLIALGTVPIIQHGHVWGTAPAPNLNEGDSLKSELNGLAKLDTFATNLSNLKPQTTYYIRAYATSSLGVSYSETVTFTTLSARSAVKPIVSMSASDLIEIRSGTSTVRASVSKLGSSDITAYGHIWAKTPNLNLAKNGILKTDLGRLGRTGTFESVVKGLEANTKYYIRAYASNKAGISYSATVTFTTSKIEDDVFTVSDPLYKDQWHLKSPYPSVALKDGGQTKIDINVEPVWRQGYFGKGVKVGIFDSYIQYNHPDLKDNLPVQNYVDPYPDEPFCTSSRSETHGTRVAGIIAARDNAVGSRGVAPQATLYGYIVLRSRAAGVPLDPNYHVQQILQALQRSESRAIAVYNGSLGDYDGSESSYSTTATEQAVLKAFDAVTANGFGGKGSALVFAAGNAAVWSGSAANNQFLNHYAVIGVNSIFADGGVIPILSELWFSAPGSVGPNIWLVAPTGSAFASATRPDLMTTDLTGKCGQEGDWNASFGGTSGATPVVTGVIALLREAYPNLTWRDVKLILAESAKKIKPLDPAKQGTWQNSGKMYSNPTKNQAYHRVMGFGLVDAGAALELARIWTPLPTMKTETFEQKVPLNTQRSGVLHSSSLPVQNSQLNFIEHVQLDLEVERPDKLYLWQWALNIVAPDGKVAQIYGQPNSNREVLSDENNLTNFTFGVNGFLGNNSINGTWKLQIRQATGQVTKITTIKNWKITIRGH